MALYLYPNDPYDFYHNPRVEECGIRAPSTIRLTPSNPPAPVFRGGWRVEWRARPSLGQMTTGVEWYAEGLECVARRAADRVREAGGTAEVKYYAELFADVELALYGPKPKPPEKSKGEKAREAYYVAFGKPGGGGPWETLSADRKAGWEAAAAEACK